MTDPAPTDTASSPTQHLWLVKTEPEEFSWETLRARGPSCWDGVRNVEARNNLRRMQVGDPVFIYHTGKERAIVGIARVVKAAYRDPSSDRAIWSAVDVEAKEPLANPVSLATIKADERFVTCPLVKRPRLSVMPITPGEWSAILDYAQNANVAAASATTEPDAGNE